MRPTLNIPNTLTWFRIALIPMFVIAFYLPYSWSNPASAVIFALAGITDWLDGYLARRLGQTSPFGAFLDPVADKLMVVVALVLIVQRDPHMSVAIALAIIIGREVAVSALREWMANIGGSRRVAVMRIAKWKTTAQISALIMMLWREPIMDVPIYTIGTVLLLIAAGLTLWSMFLYTREAWSHMQEES